MSGVDGDVMIRPGSIGDSAALGRLGAELVRQHHEFDPRRFIAPTSHTEQSYAAYLAGQLEAPNAIVLVAEVAGEVVAYAYAGVEGRDYMALRGPAGVVYDLVVDPEYRRRGIGRRLLKAIVAALRDRGAPRVVLFTASRNEAAQRLFLALRFRPTMKEMTLEVDAGG